MKPDCDVYLGALERDLLEEVAPNLPRSWEQAVVMRHMALLPVVRQELERGVQRRVEENTAMRAVFAQALNAVTDAGLVARLKEAVASHDECLLVSALDTSNHRLRSLLTDLHHHIDTCSAQRTAPAMQALEMAIWRELAASTVRRQVDLGRF
ncbi:MAG: hypothetical protein NTV17_13065 [Burkholderiales bacterium]|nr:hypothetical protein [Burkholderiales bacterium]